MSHQNQKYGFSVFHLPTKKPYLKQKRFAWIRFCRRMNVDGSPWTPSRHSKTCNVHFVGGKNDPYPHQPGFIPTLALSKRASTKNINIINRYERVKKFRLNQETFKHIDSNIESECENEVSIMDTDCDKVPILSQAIIINELHLPPTTLVSTQTDSVSSISRQSYFN
ncbi:hypothetical protein BLOT_009844 [Blomia tropicalis]|nr:hypothetical protein BLOT_009844 [Blomia tropicalis]